MAVWFSPLLPFGQIGRGADNSDMLKGLLLLRNTGNELPVPPIPGTCQWHPGQAHICWNLPARIHATGTTWHCGRQPGT